VESWLPGADSQGLDVSRFDLTQMVGKLLSIDCARIADIPRALVWLKMLDIKMTDHQNCRAWNSRTWNCKTWNYRTWKCRKWTWWTKKDGRV